MLWKSLNIFVATSVTCSELNHDRFQISLVHTKKNPKDQPKNFHLTDLHDFSAWRKYNNARAPQHKQSHTTQSPRTFIRGLARSLIHRCKFCSIQLSSWLAQPVHAMIESNVRRSVRFEMTISSASSQFSGCASAFRTFRSSVPTSRSPQRNSSNASTK